MTLIGLAGRWHVALSDDNPTADYEVLDWLEWSEPGKDEGIQPAHARVRALVEVYRLDGGKGQQAMLGRTPPGRPDQADRGRAVI
jgi:hypothetical protein